MTKKTLIIIVPAFPNKKTTFMVPFIQQFIAGFTKRHEEIRIIIYTLYMPIQEPYFWRGIEIIPLKWSSKSHFYKPYYFIKSIIKICKKIKKTKAVGILSFWYNEVAILGRVCAYISKIKNYTWLQGQDVKKNNKYLKILKPNPSFLIAISTFQNNYLYKTSGFYAKYINPISVNPSFFPELNTNKRPIDILGTGSFIPLKNFNLFVEIIIEIKKVFPNIKVCLIGNGPLEKKLKLKVKENRLTGNVSFTGLLSHKETLKFMNNSKTLLHTTTFEGGATVLYEALYSGCNVVSTFPIEKDIGDQFCQSLVLQELLSKMIAILSKPQNYKRCVPVCQEKTIKLIYDLFFV